MSEVEVMAKATRRRFSAEYKLQMLREAEACTQPGEIGALLRREGLYFSNVRTWREQRRRGELAGLAQKKRGPAPQAKNPLAGKVAALEREVTRHKARAERAEALVALQKKVSEILGIALQRNGEQA
jgi:transposase-like protein